jgi:sigma-54 specific flagellar transcriptional regulator A
MEMTLQSTASSIDTLGLIGRSAALAALRALLAQVGCTEASVLITGPSGSGKELAARALHVASPRSGPFVALNCGAIPRELLESELFGHERGAFTGAHQARVGKFEAAAGGTLFLDEIGDMPLDMQVALLRVLEERRFERIGSAKPQVADVRIVSATHRDLEAAILAGRFREDLYYRLNVFPVRMPALAERREDVVDLIAHFVAPLGTRAPIFSRSAIERLLAHDWPGNVRELRNFVERAAIRCSGLNMDATAVEASLQRPILGGPDLARLAHYPSTGFAAHPIAGPATRLAEFPEIDPARLLARGGLDLRAAMGNLERGFIEAALASSGNIVADAARALGMQRTTLVEKMKRFEVRRGGSEGSPMTA